MDDAAEKLGEQVGKALVPVALLIWGAYKCQQMSERRGVNRDAVRGLMVVLGGWAVTLIAAPFFAVLPRVMALGVGILAVLTCVAGAALSAKGLLAASEYSEGTLQGALGVLVGLGVTALLGYGFASGGSGTGPHLRRIPFEGGCCREPVAPAPARRRHVVQ
jgi:hypothetical protein